MALPSFRGASETSEPQMCNCTSGNLEIPGLRFAHPGMTATSGEKRMPTVLGSGEHRYRVVENWAKLPEGWNLTDVASVAVDSKDRVYVFHRGDHPMGGLDRSGH